MSAYTECSLHGYYDNDNGCPECDQENEDRIRNEERKRLWGAIRTKWKGDMGPAFVFVKDIEAFFQPEPSAD